jgi:hypothetical protein
MVKAKILNQQLDDYSKRGNMQNISYSAKYINQLFEQNQYFGMSQWHYCCEGEKHPCWCDLVEEGIFNLTTEEVKQIILANFKCCSEYLYNTSKYNKRFYVFKNEDLTFVYIYMRDILKRDYHMYFSNTVDC